MKNLKIALVLSFLAPAFVFATGGEHIKKPTTPKPGLAAGCAPASALIYLEFNNVRTRVESGGLWWQDRANSAPDYEIPKGSNSFALYAGGLWMGGTDINGQLKAAASLFGTGGVDYWTGPLDTLGLAEINDSVCTQYDRFFSTTRSEVAQFVAYNGAVARGTQDEDFPNYQIPTSILDWPGNGDVLRGQDFRIAPYTNVDDDPSYDPANGDFPFYDLQGNIDCRADRENRSISGRRPLFGDINYWWVFNDKGNIHTQTNAPSIGMEIHGQAFAFATNDEINDMTFYNFELINRSTFTLTNTYFASYVDPDLGDPFDDYVGCDVTRGLGYCYNGEAIDDDFQGRNGYGSTPAAIGIDFFEGPYQDADGINNNVGIGPGEALNGLGYFDPTELNPDRVVDNERFGMRRFVYYINGGGNNGDPDLAVHFYNYMRGIWKNGRRMLHGGDGFDITSAAVENIETDFMFPGTSDPLHWGTTDEAGITSIPLNQNWTEDNPGGGLDRNDPNDRRFLQSAGPFTLEPGNVNDITVGVVFAQAQSGGRLASVEKLFQADDKAQALFDNCFQVLNGPDAPLVDVQELDKELVFYLTNPESSNNFGERYAEKDPNIVTPEFLLNQSPPIFYDDSFRFQGYQVYQLAGPGISVSDIDDPDKARLVFQTDVKDDVSHLINFEFDEDLNASVPVRKVTAANEGIQRSFSLTEDLFASGVSSLVNFKTYYYIAIAYGYNEFKPYLQGSAPDSANPFKPAFDGQRTPYIASRKSGDQSSVTPFTAIPHDPLFEQNGSVINSSYGDEIGITRLQGTGNGGRALRITNESVENILNQRAWEDDSTFVTEIDYSPGQGPFAVSVIDPLNVVEGTYYLQFLDENVPAQVPDSTKWKLWLDGGGPDDTTFSEKTIQFENNQLLLDPNWGLSITIGDGIQPGSKVEGTMNGFISSSITYEDETREWLSGIPDSDSEDPNNWILSGTFTQSQVTGAVFNDYIQPGTTDDFVDPEEGFETVLDGVFAPYRLTRYATAPAGASQTEIENAVNPPASGKADVEGSPLSKLYSLQLVITSDKSKWSRCPVIDTKDDGSGTQLKNMVKLKPSIDKEGNPVDTTGFGDSSLTYIDTTFASNNENDPGFISAIGMGWFPGYVINKETGDRMNIAYGEDSRYSFNNGDDMIWNPTEIVLDGFLQPINRVWGGKHFIYIFREIEDEGIVYERFNAEMPVYDNGVKLRELLSQSGSSLDNLRRQLGWSSCSWVGLPVLQAGETLLSNDVRIDVNVSKEFAVRESTLPDELDNDGKPVYRFNTAGRGTQKGQTAVLSKEIERINIVPNPYYALSEYETTQLDNTVKITNLPENCKITIYNTNGTLIRTYNKSSPLTFLDWDLTNQVGIPISSGVYIVHVDVPGVGEKILKWFGVVRPVDLNNF